jgi:hypothetical protein
MALDYDALLEINNNYTRMIRIDPEYIPYSFELKSSILIGDVNIDDCFDGVGPLTNSFIEVDEDRKEEFLDMITGDNLLKIRLNFKLSTTDDYQKMLPRINQLNHRLSNTQETNLVIVVENYARISFFINNIVNDIKSNNQNKHIVFIIPNNKEDGFGQGTNTSEARNISTIYLIANYHGYNDNNLSMFCTKNRYGHNGTTTRISNIATKLDLIFGEGIL